MKLLGGSAPCFRLRHFLLILIAAVDVHALDTTQMPMYAEHQLMKELFENYESSVRPYLKVLDPVHVSFGVSLVNILELNQVTETLDAFLFIRHAWHDNRLQWNRTQYMNVTELRLPPAKVWKPDIISYNNVDSAMRTSDSMVVAVASGHLFWMTPLRLRTTCRVDLRNFPFDEQTCSWYFGSWAYNGNQINLTFWGDRASESFELESEKVSTEWTVLKHSAAINHKSYCCQETYQDFVVTMTLKRNPLYYVHVFIVPALLIGLLVPFHMLLPPDSCERMTLGSILMASLLLLILKLQDALPNAHSQLPAIGLFYTLSLLWSFLAMVSSILVLNLHSRGPRRGKVPETIRWIFLRSLKRLVCLGSDTYYLINDMETITMRGLDNPKTSFTPSINPAERRDQTGLGDARANVRLERETEEISRQLHVLGARAHLQDSRAETVNEWRLVALVLDRILFFVFFIIYLLCAVIVLA